ncbi:MAG: oligosaccharide flippase family protein [Actinomycetota bacterium]|nr:oligosaccharide flippase family protein [Actinomycetota bacterium]
MHAIAAELAGLLAGVANFLLLARALGPADYGVIAGAWALILATSPVAILGANRLVTRGIASRGQRPSEALGEGLLTVVLGGTVALVLLVALHPFLLPQVPVELIVGLGIADIFCLGATLCLSALLYATGSGRAVSLVAVVSSTAKLAAVLIFTLTGGDDPVRWAQLYASLSVLAVVLQLGWSWRRFGRPSPGWRGLWDRARSGFGFSLNNASVTVLTDFDKTLLVRDGFTTDAGVYGVAYRLTTMAALPIIGVMHATFPRFFAIGEAGGLRATTAFARKLAFPLAAYGVLAGLTLIVVAPLIPLVVGEGFRPSVAVLMLLAGLPLLRPLQSLPSDALTGADMQSTRTACWGAAAVLNVGLNLILIPRHGLTGALVTTGISELFLLALVALAVRHGLRRAEEDQRAAAPVTPTTASPTVSRPS